MPMNQTISAERAADDLTRQRGFEAAAQSPSADEVATGIDQARHNVAQLQQGIDPQQVQQQPQQQEQQPQDPNADAIRQALENPAVRAALEAEVAQVEQVRGQYQAAALQAAQLAAAATFAFAPELQNISAAEIPIAMRLIAAKDPQRAAAIEQHVQRTQALYQASQQAAQQQQAIAQQRNVAWIKAQDDAYEAAVKDTPEMKSKLGNEAVAMLREYGATDDEIRAAYNSPGVFRSAVGQRVLRDAAAYRLAQKEVANKVDRSVPPVQRPGVSQPTASRSDAEVAAAMKQFNANPSVENAAKLLRARRGSR